MYFYNDFYIFISVCRTLHEYLGRDWIQLTVFSSPSLYTIRQHFYCWVCNPFLTQHKWIFHGWFRTSSSSNGVRGCGPNSLESPKRIPLNLILVRSDRSVSIHHGHSANISRFHAFGTKANCDIIRIWIIWCIYVHIVLMSCTRQMSRFYIRHWTHKVQFSFIIVRRNIPRLGS